MSKIHNGTGGAVELSRNGSMKSDDPTHDLSSKPHPLASVAGIFADDPTWDEFIQAMQDARREENEADAAHLDAATEHV